MMTDITNYNRNNLMPSVLAAFAASGRRHLFITGARGIGKSTLVRALCDSIPCRRITTAARPMSEVRMTDGKTGGSAQIGIFDPTLPGTSRKMRPTPDGFARFGCELLLRCMRDDREWICIDEIGYLEGSCRPYLDALDALMAKKRLIAVVRRDHYPHLSALLQRDDAFVLDLDRPHGNIGCVIMASGMGVRFGGNKLMADFAGEPMIARILASTDGIFARRVVVTRHADVRAFCEARGVGVVLHDLPDRNDTVRLGLEAVGAVDACMFAPADQPLLRRESISTLAMAAASDPGTIFRAGFADTVGAPVVFPSWAFDALRVLPKGMGGGYVIRQHPQNVKTVSVSDPLELCDADTKESLQMLLQALKKQMD